MTGIYILKTKDGYRVTLSDQFTNLFGNYNDKLMNYEVKPDILHQMFDKSQFFLNYTDSIIYAKGISKTSAETDDGIFVINNCESLNYWEI